MYHAYRGYCFGKGTNSAGGGCLMRGGTSPSPASSSRNAAEVLKNYLCRFLRSVALQLISDHRSRPQPHRVILETKLQPAWATGIHLGAAAHSCIKRPTEDSINHLFLLPASNCRRGSGGGRGKRSSAWRDTRCALSSAGPKLCRPDPCAPC